MRGKKLPPTPNAESQNGWSGRLTVLLACLEEIEAAIAGGAWADIDALHGKLQRQLADLQNIKPGPSARDAIALREAIALAARLTTQAQARQETIKPLLDGFSKQAPGTGPRP